MHLLMDGRENNSVLGFCLRMISQHGGNWPPTEDVLAQEFADWFDLRSVLTRDGLKELCKAKGVSLSFATLPQDIRGVNCSFHDKKEIVIAEHELAPLADVHTLLHEFRELMEHEFIELRHATVRTKASLEVQAEIFAMTCRVYASNKEMPAFFEMVSTVENRWLRYLGYAFVFAFSFAHLFGCIYMRQLEEIGSEAQGQRYVRT